MLKVPGLDSLVAKVIISDPSTSDKALGEQIDKSISQPLQKVGMTLSACPTLVVVVDAPDEWEKNGDIEVILDLWSQLPQITTTLNKGKAGKPWRFIGARDGIVVKKLRLKVCPVGIMTFVG